MNKEDIKIKGSSLEGKFILVMIIGIFLMSLLFFSAKITGNAVFNSSLRDSNFIGIGLFLVSLIAAFFYFRNRK